jgi:hypothetical protein
MSVDIDMWHTCPLNILAENRKGTIVIMALLCQSK